MSLSQRLLNSFANSSKNNDDDDSFVQKPKERSPLLDMMSNVVQVTRESTDKIKKKSNRAVKSKNSKNAEQKDESQPERKSYLNAFSASKYMDDLKVNLTSVDIDMRILRWSISYFGKEIFASNKSDDEWTDSRRIEFSIADVDLHVLYDTFELKCDYELEDDNEHLYTGRFNIKVRLYRDLPIRITANFLLGRILPITRAIHLRFSGSLSSRTRAFSNFQE